MGGDYTVLAQKGRVGGLSCYPPVPCGAASAPDNRSGERGMFRVVLAGFLLLLSHSVLAFKFPIEMIEGVNGARVIVYVAEGDIERGAGWVPFKGAPPLSLVKALATVREHLAKIPSMQDATLKEVQLRQIPRREDIWHYMVVMQSMKDGKPVLHYYVVLMSGKFIPAILEPESYK